MLVLSVQTYLQFHKKFMSVSINIVITGTSKQTHRSGGTKKVVNFLFRLLLLESFLFSSFRSFQRVVYCAVWWTSYKFFTIAVCCQSHKNLNCSIKSPPTTTTALKNIKSWEVSDCVFTFLLIKQWDWVALKLFRTEQQKKLKYERWSFTNEFLIALPLLEHKSPSTIGW